MIERLYERPLGEYLARLHRASQDVDNKVATIDEAVSLYGVNKLDLCQLVLEKAEWNQYVRGYSEEL